MEQQIDRFEITLMGNGEAATHDIPVQINLFCDQGKTIGYLKFLAAHAGTREHQCDTEQITVWYRHEQFQSVLHLLTTAGAAYVSCRGTRNSGIRVKP